MPAYNFTLALCLSDVLLPRSAPDALWSVVQSGLELPHWPHRPLCWHIKFQPFFVIVDYSIGLIKVHACALIFMMLAMNSSASETAGIVNPALSWYSMVY